MEIKAKFRKQFLEINGKRCVDAPGPGTEKAATDLGHESLTSLMWHPIEFMLIKNPRPSILVQIFLFQAPTFPDRCLWTDFFLSTSKLHFLA